MTWTGGAPVARPLIAALALLGAPVAAATESADLLLPPMPGDRPTAVLVDHVPEPLQRPGAPVGDAGEVDIRREQRIPPCATAAPLSWADAWARYGSILAAVAAVFLLLVVGFATLWRAQRRLGAARVALAAAENQWLKALDAVGHGVWDWDVGKSHVYYSPTWKMMLGFAEDEIGAGFREWMDRIHPDDLRPTLQELERYLTGESRVFNLMHRLLAKDGGYRWVLARGIVITRDAQGRATRVIGTTTDLTQYRETEIALAEKDALFSAVVSQSLDGMVLIDPETLRFVELNQAACDGLGCSAEELAQLTISDVDAMQTRAEQLAWVDKIACTGAAIFDTRHRRKDGRLRDVRVSAGRIEKRGRMYIAAVFKDLTDLREAERERAANERRFQTAFEQAAVGMAILAPDGRFLRVNARLCQMLGYAAEALCQLCEPQLTPPPHAATTREQLDALLRGEQASLTLEKPYLRRDAKPLWVLLTVSLIRDAQGAAEQLFAVVEDISERQRTEAQLRFAAQVVAAAPYAIIATDLKGEITYFNPAAETLLQRSAAEVIGRVTPLDFHLEEEIQRRAVELSDRIGRAIAPDFAVFREAALAAGQDTREWTLRRRDGSRLPALLSTSLLYDSRGEPNGLLGNLVDITPPHQANQAMRDERNRAQRYMDAASALMVSLDLAGRITRANRYACALLGVAEAQLLGRHWIHCCVAPSAAAPLAEVVERLVRGEAGTAAAVEATLRCAGGQERLVALHHSLLEDEAGAILGVLAVGNDVTEHRALELARARALDEAEQLAQAKNAFLANMSHEIRTPLNAILGCARIGCRDAAQAPVREHFTQIETAGQHLLALLNDILDLSKLEADKLSIACAPFHLRGCLAELQALLDPQASAKGLKLSLAVAPDVPAWVTGDVLRLRQILLNLLGNAVKFTEQGEIRLLVSRTAEWLSFEVADTGVGMSDDQIARIFRPFVQVAQGTTRSAGGTGLGLAISQRLAERMGGSIRVESRQGQGSRFTLRVMLPEAVAPEQAPSPDTPRREGGRLAGLHLLAADDVEVNLMILDDMLWHEGARVQRVTNGQEAVEAVRDAPDGTFDGVLMDVQMPLLDGYEATRQIHRLAPGLPVIGLTAYALADEQRRCLEAGMVSHVAKPVETEQLVDAILRWTGRGAERQAAQAPASAPPLAAATATATAGADLAGAAANIDWAALESRFARSPGFVRQLAEMALVSEAETASRVRAAGAAADLDALLRRAHAIKGLAGNLCAESLQALAADICEQARAGNTDALQQSERLAEGISGLLRELEAYVARSA